MSEWPGFDQRRICPQCGGYQTHFWKAERRSGSGLSKTWVLIALGAVGAALLALLLVIGLTRRTWPGLGDFAGLFFTLLLGLVSLLLNPAIYRAIFKKFHPPGSQPEPPPAEETNRVCLECWDCGCRWEMPLSEWEQRR